MPYLSQRSSTVAPLLYSHEYITLACAKKVVGILGGESYEAFHPAKFGIELKSPIRSNAPCNLRWLGTTTKPARVNMFCMPLVKVRSVPSMKTSPTAEWMCTYEPCRASSEMTREKAWTKMCKLPPSALVKCTYLSSVKASSGSRESRGVCSRALETLTWWPLLLARNHKSRRTDHKL